MVKRFSSPAVIETDDSGNNPVAIFIGPDKREIRSNDEEYANSVAGAAGTSRTVMCGGKVQMVSVRNPLAISSVSEPVEIRISFAPGECLSADYLRVYDSVGVEVPRQWEYAIDPATWEEVDKTWPDGSIRRGSVWILADLGPSEVKTYSVVIAGGSASYPQGVTYTAETATLWVLQSSQLMSRMADSTAWMPKILRDPSRSNANYNSTSNGLYHRMTLAGVNKFSHTASDVTALSSSRIGTSNPGYGVVFQEIEGQFSWAAATGVTVKTRVRHFANNFVRWTSRVEVSTEVASGSHGMSVYHEITNSTAPTAAYNTTNGWAGYAYPSGATLCTAMAVIQQESDALRLTSYTPLADFASNSVRLGWANNPVTIPVGAYFTFGGFYSAGYDSLENAGLRGHNPVIARANSARRADILRSIRYSSTRLIKAWTAIGLSDPDKSYWGSVALGWMVMAEEEGREAPIRDALALFQKWCTEYNITPTSATSWHDKWNHSTSQLGLEYMGPNSGCLPIIREKALELGLTTTAATVTSYIHAMADFAVQMEVTSGGSGQVKLRYSDGDNYNAEATAMLFLCRSLAITSDSTRQATLDRIAARFAAGYTTTAGIPNKMGYSYQTPGGTLRDSIRNMRAAYHFYNIGVALHAHSIYPCLPSLPDARQFALEYSNGRQLDERKWSKQLERRGIVGNWIAAAYTLAMSSGATDGDLRAAADYLDYVSARTGLQNPGAGILIDGYIYPDTDSGYGLWGGPESASMHMHLLHAINSGYFD